MFCPKCGAQVENKATVCPYCKAEIETAAETAAAVSDAPAAAASAATEVQTETKAPKKNLISKINFKEPKTLLICGAAILALFLLIAAIVGIVTAVQASTGPEKTAEIFAEAMAEGDIKKVLKKSAPWTRRSAALSLDLKENASVSKIAKEYKELGGVEKMGKIKIIDSYITSYRETSGGAMDSSIFASESSATYKEVKSITEIAAVTVEASIRNIEQSYDVEFDITCARYNGKWIVIGFDIDSNEW